MTQGKAYEQTEKKTNKKNSYQVKESLTVGRMSIRQYHKSNILFKTRKSKNSLEELKKIMAVGLWQNYVEGIVTSSTQYIKYSNETKMKKILNSPEKKMNT